MVEKYVYTNIKDIRISNNKMIFDTDKGQYYTLIEKGSIECLIKTSCNKQVPLSYLDIGDLVKIKIIDNNKINKIYIQSKYVLLSESSDDD
jgi:hypothetical protein